MFFSNLKHFSYLKHKLSFWLKRNVPHPKPNILTFGINFKRFTQGPEIYTKEQLENHGKVFGGYMLLTPILVVNDAELIKQIMIKDFHLFMDKPDQGMISKDIFLTVLNDFFH